MTAGLIVNDVVLVEIKIAPQYDRRDEAQLLNVPKAATGLRVGRSPQSRPVHGRTQTAHLRGICV